MRKSVVAIALTLALNANAAQAGAGELAQWLCRPIKSACESGGAIAPWLMSAAQASLGMLVIDMGLLCVLVDNLCPEETSKLKFAEPAIF